MAFTWSNMVIKTSRAKCLCPQTCREYLFPVFVVESVFGRSRLNRGFAVAVFLWLMLVGGCLVRRFSVPRQCSYKTDGVVFPGLYYKQCFVCLIRDYMM